MKKKIIISVVILALIGGSVFGGVKYNQHLKEKAHLEEQARAEAEKQALEERAKLEAAEQAQLIGTYKAEARTYYDAHTKDFIFEPDMTRERFTDEYVTLRQAGSTGDEAIESIRNAYWAVTYFENPETVYCSKEDWADYFETPTSEESLGSFGYCEEVETIGLAEKYNKETELKDVMYVIPKEVGEDTHRNVVSSISNFVEEKTPQMIEREKALAEQKEAEKKAKEEIQANASGDSSTSQVPAALADRTVPYKPGAITDYATGRTYNIGADVGDGYYGGGAYVGHDTKGNAYIVDKEGYEEYLQVLEDNKTAVRYPDQGQNRTTESYDVEHGNGW